MTLVARSHRHEPAPRVIVTRAESEFERRRREAERAQADADRLNAKRCEVSQAARRAAELSLGSPHASLRDALNWFRWEWQAAIPTVMHTHSEDIGALGGPAWAERFRSYLMGRRLRDQPDGDAEGPMSDPFRACWARMWLAGSLADRIGAMFLFRLACLDWDWVRTGETMDPPIGDAYIELYTQQAIDRLRVRFAGQGNPSPWQFRALNQGVAGQRE